MNGQMNWPRNKSLTVLSCNRTISPIYPSFITNNYSLNCNDIINWKRHVTRYLNTHTNILLTCVIGVHRTKHSQTSFLDFSLRQFWCVLSDIKYISQKSMLQSCFQTSVQLPSGIIWASEQLPESHPGYFSRSQIL